MTTTADRTGTSLATSDAHETLLEMAAVIRTVFGVGLKEPRRAPAPVTPDAVAPQQVTPADEAPALPPAIALPSEDVLPEHRHAVLREIAFLDD